MFYCKSNLRNGFFMPDLYEQVVLFVFLCHLAKTPNKPHGTLVHPVNINVCSRDIPRSLKK